MPTSPESFDRSLAKLEGVAERNLLRYLVGARSAAPDVTIQVIQDPARLSELGELLFGDEADADVVIEGFRAVGEALTKAVTESLGARVEGVDEEERRRIEAVQASFGYAISDIARRWWVKRTAKTPIPRTVRWDVSLVVEDDDEGQAPNGDPVPLATVSFVGAGDTGETTEFVLAMDAADVGFTIEILRRLESAMTRAEGSDDGDE